jgi:hypothetical protein
MSAAWDIKSEVAWTDQDDRVAVLDLDRLQESPLVLTSTGGSIWRAIDAERDEDAIVLHVAELHEVDPDEIREQVLAFLTDLAQRHLIVRT